MRLSRLIPVCLISVLMGLLLPRLFEKPSELTLAAAGYLGVLWVVDRFFGKPAASEPE